MARRRRLRASGQFRLRQDHASQHHLGPRAAVARTGAVWRPGRDEPAHGGPRHRAGVPVPGRLRHHDGAPEPRLSAEEPGRPRIRDRPPRSRRRGHDRDGGDAGPPRAGADGRRQAEDQPGARYGAPRRERDPLRRAADGDRPAHEVGAAHAAEIASPRVRAHDDLRHPRPDRGADLRRRGRRHVRGAGGAGGHAAVAVRPPRTHLRRLLHRLARHEPAGRADRRRDRAGGGRGRAARRALPAERGPGADRHPPRRGAPVRRRRRDPVPA